MYSRPNQIHNYIILRTTVPITSLAQPPPPPSLSLPGVLREGREAKGRLAWFCFTLRHSFAEKLSRSPSDHVHSAAGRGHLPIFFKDSFSKDKHSRITKKGAGMRISSLAEVALATDQSGGRANIGMRMLAPTAHAPVFPKCIGWRRHFPSFRLFCTPRPSSPDISLLK